MTKKKIDELFFLLFCEKNSDGTKHLRLQGRELYQRIGKRLNAENMSELATFLLKYPDIISINLSYNDIGDEGLRILSKEVFSQENKVQYLNLMHCDILAHGLHSLTSATCLKLRKVWLLGNKFGVPGARYIGSLLEKCPDLELLDIGETDQTLESIESILTLIEKGSLKHLNISKILPSSYYSQYNDTIVADDLGNLLKMNETLEVLRIQKFNFDGHDIELLLGGLYLHKKLTLLDLGANRIGSHGAELLAEWLKTRPNLIALRLASNTITTPGAQALGLALPFSRIRYLDLHDNKIGDKGLAEIIDSLKKSTQMRLLFIWGNKIGKRVLPKLERILKAGTLKQENIDVQIYYVDGERKAAYYPANYFEKKSFSLSPFGFPPELSIKRVKIPHSNAQPRALIQLDNIDRFPPVNEQLGLKVAKIKPDNDIIHKSV
ncbi:hypothetical protein ABEB36_005186 [Hypothenemus hampei]|uniref:Uncharacterized protein n=1 Tax=Hypothenemus hampei TaxID=57062 RepID=A0ABD1EXB8_HYPHA